MADFLCDSPKFGARSSVVITEGKDDALFLSEVLRRRGANPGVVGVYAAGSKSEVLGFLPVFLKLPEFTSSSIKRYCVIIDADLDHRRTADDVHKVLSAHNQPTPPAGRVVQGGQGAPIVGLYLFPRTGHNGILEDLCVAQLPSELAKTDTINFVAAHMPPEELPKFNKRVVQAYLSVRVPHQCAGVGRGIRNGSFPLDIAALDELTTFLDFFS